MPISILPDTQIVLFCSHCAFYVMRAPPLTFSSTWLIVLLLLFTLAISVHLWVLPGSNILSWLLTRFCWMRAVFSVFVHAAHPEPRVVFVPLGQRSSPSLMNKPHEWLLGASSSQHPVHGGADLGPHPQLSVSHILRGACVCGRWVPWFLRGRQHPLLLPRGRAKCGGGRVRSWGLFPPLLAEAGPVVGGGRRAPQHRWRL